MKKRILAVTMILFLSIFHITLPVEAAKYEKSTGVEEDYLQSDAKVPKLYSDAAILMDAKTGEILFQKNPQKKEYPASITKCMTSLVAIENNDLNDIITYSEDAIFNVESNSSGVALDVGEQLTVDQSLYGAMLESANECCNGLAEHTAGSVEGFVELMNAKAKELGCVNTHFMNANGLYNKNHYTCVYDMALIVKEALKNENWRNYSGTLVYEMPPTNKQKETRYWRNHHSFVNKDLLYDSTTYTVEGGKTGYTVKCKNTLVSYAKSNSSDMELICVVMRCEDYFYKNGRSFSCVYKDTSNLFDYGFNNFTTISSAVDFSSQLDDTQSNYMYETYEMLQPNKFISFQADSDCRIAVSNTYDTSKLEGTLVFDKNDESGKWGTYQFTSSGNVISSTDVYYSLNQDVLKELYRSSSRTSNLSHIKRIIVVIGIIMIALLFILGIVKMVKTYSLVNIFSRRGMGSIQRGKGLNSFKPSRRRKSRRVNYGYIDSSRRRRRRRYSKKNKLHF